MARDEDGLYLKATDPYPVTIMQRLRSKSFYLIVRCVDVAEQLGVKKPSVSRAVKELIKSGHLVKNADGTLSLTELGLQIAEQIYEKHLFFTKQLILAGVDPETAEQDACGIEHAVSSESFQKLKKAFDDG